LASQIASASAQRSLKETSNSASDKGLALIKCLRSLVREHYTWHSFSKSPFMMSNMTCQNVCQTADCDARVACSSPSIPSGRRETPERNHIRLTQAGELGDDVCQRTIQFERYVGVRILGKALQRRLVASGNAEHTISKYAFGVRNVVQRLTQFPSVRWVHGPRCGFRKRSPPGDRCIQLVLEHRQNLFFRDKSHVSGSLL